MRANRFFAVCLAVLSLLTLLVGCGKEPEQPEPEPFDGAFNLVMTSEYEGKLTKVHFQLSTQADEKKAFFVGAFSEPYRTPEDMQPLVCGKQYSIHITDLEALSEVVDAPGFQGIWARFEVDGQERGRVFIPREQLYNGTVQVVLNPLGNIVDGAL